MQKNLNKMLQETYLLTCLEVISRVPMGFGGDRSIFNFKRVGEATIFTRFPVITYPGPRGFLAVGFASPLVLGPGLLSPRLEKTLVKTQPALVI